MARRSKIQDGMKEEKKGIVKTLTYFRLLCCVRLFSLRKIYETTKDGICTKMKRGKVVVR